MTAGTRTVEMAAGQRRGDVLKRTPLGESAALGDIVRVGSSVLCRETGQRMITVTGDILGEDPARSEAMRHGLCGRACFLWSG